MYANLEKCCIISVLDINLIDLRVQYIIVRSDGMKVSALKSENWKF